MNGSQSPKTSLISTIAAPNYQKNISTPFSLCMVRRSSIPETTSKSTIIASMRQSWSLLSKSATSRLSAPNKNPSVSSRASTSKHWTHSSNPHSVQTGSSFLGTPYHILLFHSNLWAHALLNTTGTHGVQSSRPHSVQTGSSFLATPYHNLSFHSKHSLLDARSMKDEIKDDFILKLFWY